MRLYRSGDQGEPVRDIQDRLSALGFSSKPDHPGTFDVATHQAVKRFQGARNLAADGIVGPDTWRSLVGAGYHLGTRMLYHRVPMMRGDDVAELQRRLSSLGFDSGKVDGIFGPDTLDALLDFQANRRMAEDGIAGTEVSDELERMGSAATRLGLDRQGREIVRERQWLAALPDHIAGQHVYVDAFCRTGEEATETWGAALIFSRIIQDLGAVPMMSRSADTAPDQRVRALRANRAGVDLIVSFSHVRGQDHGVLYFASTHSQSAAGEKLAKAVATRLDFATHGRAIPILKDTRSPCIVIATEPMDPQIGGVAAQGLIDLFASDLETL